METSTVLSDLEVPSELLKICKLFLKSHNAWTLFSTSLVKKGPRSYVRYILVIVPKQVQTANLNSLALILTSQSRPTEFTKNNRSFN